MLIKRKGETLLEVLIAVTLLTLVLIAVFSLLNVSLNSQENIKNRIIATTIAEEGIEAVRNIRDTNWLKYSGDRRVNWLCVDNDLNSNCPTKLTDGLWRIYYDDSDGRYYMISDVTATAHDFYIDFNGNQTRFKRRIEVDIQNPFDDNDGGFVVPNFCDSDDLECIDAKVKIVSRVQWVDGEDFQNFDPLKVQEIELETFLFDFFGRNEY